MSRCFPFPPPGFVPNDALIDSIEKEKKKATKEKNKRREKKRKAETSADVNGKKDKKHKDKKRKLDENSLIDKKAGNEPASALEGSGTTEEQGLPAVQCICNSPYASQDSSKRMKIDNTADDVKNCLVNGIRIRLPLVKIKESAPTAAIKSSDVRHALSTSDLSSLTARQSQPPALAIRHREPLIPITKKSEPQLETLGHTRTPIHTSRHLNSSTIEKPQPPASVIRQLKHPSAAIQPKVPTNSVRLPKDPSAVLHPDASIDSFRQTMPPAGVITQSEVLIDSLRQSNPPAGVITRSEVPINSARLPKHLAAAAIQPEALINSFKQNKKTSTSSIGGKHPEERDLAIKKQNQAVIKSVRTDVSLKVVKQHKQPVSIQLDASSEVVKKHQRSSVHAIKPPELSRPPAKQPKQHIPNVKQPAQVTEPLSARPANVEPCFSAGTKSSFQERECPVREPQPVSDRPCFSGRTEVAALHKVTSAQPCKPEATLGFSGNSSSRRREAKFRDLFETWTPPLMQMELPFDDLEWLIVSNSRDPHKTGTACQADDKLLPLAGKSSLSSWPPRAHHLPGADICVLPYVIPF